MADATPIMIVQRPWTISLPDQAANDTGKWICTRNPRIDYRLGGLGDGPNREKQERFEREEKVIEVELTGN